MRVPTAMCAGRPDKEYGVKVFDDKGVAIHIDPKPCIGVREGTGEASAGARAGRPLSLEKCGIVQSADAVTTAEGNTDGRATASTRLALRGQRTRHARTFLAREPGYLLDRPLRAVARIGKVMSRSR
jgi:hypothetical protein